MGFPVGYSEMLLPKILLQVLLLLSHLRRLISWAFDVAGLGDLLDSDAPWPETTGENHPNNHPHHQHQHPRFQSVSAMLIQELLPAVPYEGAPGEASDGGCAVCLYEFEGGEEVRRLSNCRHVYHRCCLDRWIEHEQSTCPLCRAPLFPRELAAVHGGVWSAAGVPDSYLESDYEASSLLHSSLPSPFHPLLSAD